MTRLALTVALLCFASVAVPADPPALLITPGGHYFVVLDSAGEPTLVKITKVIRIGEAPPDGPDEPVPPPAPEVTTQVKGWSAEVNHPVGAQAMALIYRTIAEKIDDGSLKPEDAFPAIKAATDQVLPTVGGKGKWDDWRVKVGDLITSKLQSGDLQHPRQLVTFLTQVADGLDASAKASPALDPKVLSAIVELILRLLELFGVGGGGGPGPV
jgi:hypothetical protein